MELLVASTLSRRDQAVLGVLEEFGRDGGMAWAIAVRLRWAGDGRSVMPHLKRLRDAGLVRKDGERWVKEDGGG